MNTINKTSCCYRSAVLIQEFSVTVFFINKHRSSSVPNSNSNINLFVADQVVNFKWPLRWWGKTALLPLLQRSHSSLVLLHLTALILLLELYHSLSACVPLSISTELPLHTLIIIPWLMNWNDGNHLFVNLLTSRTPWCTVVLMFKGFLEGFSPMTPRVSSMYSIADWCTIDTPWCITFLFTLYICESLNSLYASPKSAWLSLSLETLSWVICAIPRPASLNR